MNYIGKILIFVGIIILTVGLIIYFAGNNLNWFTNTHLDFKFEGESTHFYAPIGNMILVRVVISLILNLFARFFK